MEHSHGEFDAHYGGIVEDDIDVKYMEKAPGILCRII